MLAEAQVRALPARYALARVAPQHTHYIQQDLQTVTSLSAHTHPQLAARGLMR